MNSDQKSLKKKHQEIKISCEDHSYVHQIFSYVLFNMLATPPNTEKIQGQQFTQVGPL